MLRHVTVQNETAKALQGILEHLDKAEREKLKQHPYTWFLPGTFWQPLARLG